MTEDMVTMMFDSSIGIDQVAVHAPQTLSVAELMIAVAYRYPTLQGHVLAKAVLSRLIDILHQPQCVVKHLDANFLDFEQSEAMVLLQVMKAPSLRTIDLRRGNHDMCTPAFLKELENILEKGCARVYVHPWDMKRVWQNHVKSPSGIIHSRDPTDTALQPLLDTVTKHRAAMREMQPLQNSPQVEGPPLTSSRTSLKEELRRHLDVLSKSNIPLLDLFFKNAARVEQLVASERGQHLAASVAFIRDHPPTSVRERAVTILQNAQAYTKVCDRVASALLLEKMRSQEEAQGALSVPVGQRQSDDVEAAMKVMRAVMAEALRGYGLTEDSAAGHINELRQRAKRGDLPNEEAETLTEVIELVVQFRPAMDEQDKWRSRSPPDRGGVIHQTPHNRRSPSKRRRSPTPPSRCRSPPRGFNRSPPRQRSRSPPPPKMPLHPCVVQYGSCSFGERCQYRNLRGDICRAWLNGKCRFAELCKFRHSKDPNGPPLSEELADAPPPKIPISAEGTRFSIDITQPLPIYVSMPQFAPPVSEELAVLIPDAPVGHMTAQPTDHQENYIESRKQNLQKIFEKQRQEKREREDEEVSLPSSCSPPRRNNGSPPRRNNGSPRRSSRSPPRRSNGSPQRRSNGSPRRSSRSPPRGFNRRSPRRSSRSPPRRSNGSPQRRSNGSPRRSSRSPPRRNSDPKNDVPFRQFLRILVSATCGRMTECKQLLMDSLKKPFGEQFKAIFKSLREHGLVNYRQGKGQPIMIGISAEGERFLNDLTRPLPARRNNDVSLDPFRQFLRIVLSATRGRMTEVNLSPLMNPLKKALGGQFKEIYKGLREHGLVNYRQGKGHPDMIGISAEGERFLNDLTRPLPVFVSMPQLTPHAGRAARIAKLLADYQDEAKSGEDVAKDVRAALAYAAERLEKRLAGFKAHPLPDTASAEEHQFRAEREAEVAGLSKALEETTKKVAAAGNDLERTFEAGKEVLGDFLYSKETTGLPCGTQGPLVAIVTPSPSVAPTTTKEPLREEPLQEAAESPSGIAHVSHQKRAEEEEEAKRGFMIGVEEDEAGGSTPPEAKGAEMVTSRGEELVVDETLLSEPSADANLLIERELFTEEEVKEWHEKVPIVPADTAPESASQTCRAILLTGTRKGESCGHKMPCHLKGHMERQQSPPRCHTDVMEKKLLKETAIMID